MASSTENARRRRERLLAANLCVRCGRNPPAEGIKSCRVCADKYCAIEERRAKDASYAARGICTQCRKRPADSGLMSCQTCRNYQRQWRVVNRETINAKERVKANARNAQVRDEVVTAYGGCCACCGERHRSMLAIDHIFGDGAAHRRATFGRRAPSTANIYAWLKRQGFPKDRFQLLCHNCNWSKGTGLYCEHQLERMRQSA